MLALLWSCARDVPTFAPSDIVGVGDVSFEPREGAKVHAEYATGDEEPRSSPAVDGGAGKLTLVGLRAGETYHVALVFDDGKRLDAIRVKVPPAPADAPRLTASEADDGCDPDGYVLFSWVADETSGVAIVDRRGHYVWAVANADAGVEITRARLGRDGDSVLYNLVDRRRAVVDGAIVRRSLDAHTLTRTIAFWAHDDFLELADHQLAWLAYERTQPNDGATSVLLATDTIFETFEGNQAKVVGVPDEGEVFSTLGDYKQGVYRMPEEGIDGRSVPGCIDFGRATSLAYREDDDRFFLMWELVDTLLQIHHATGEVDWEWGGWYSDFELPLADQFQHARLSEVWDGRALVFDNRRSDPSRLVEYAFDDQGAEIVWSWQADGHEEGPGDVRRVATGGSCDNLLVTWPSEHRIFELTRDGEVVWELTLDGAEIARAQVVDAL